MTSNGILNNKTMLEFREVFGESQEIKVKDILLIKQCKNIDLRTRYWFCGLFTYYIHEDDKLMTHLVNNIIDIYAYADIDDTHYTFASGVLRNGTTSMVKYMFNNRYLSNNGINYMCMWAGSHIRLCKQLRQLINYLTMVSFNKFWGYCNTEKYHGMIYIMLLVTKVQKRLPFTIVKHLIIPFIYQ